MKQINLKIILDDLLHAITSDSFLKINKRIIDSIEPNVQQSIKINEAKDGHFLVLPKGIELLHKNDLRNFFSAINKEEVEQYKLNYITQDYLEQNGYFEVVWDLLDEKQMYANINLAEYLSPQQLKELNFHQTSNSNHIKTKGYWFWRFYIECTYLNQYTEIYRIYCKEWGNKFLVRYEAVK